MRGAKWVSFMTWAYAEKPVMTALLAKQYTIAGSNSDALANPAGLAFAEALSKNPKIILYDADRRNPSFSERISLLAQYALRYKKSQAGNPYDAEIYTKTTHLLQEMAWKTVGDNFGK